MNGLITVRVAKRAKVMFSQASVILSMNGGGGGWHQMHHGIGHMVRGGEGDPVWGGGEGGAVRGRWTSPLPWTTPIPPRQDPPPWTTPSYWNAFLLNWVSTLHYDIIRQTFRISLYFSDFAMLGCFEFQNQHRRKLGTGRFLEHNARLLAWSESFFLKMSPLCQTIFPKRMFSLIISLTVTTTDTFMLHVKSW